MEKIIEITRREFLKYTGLLAGSMAIGSTPFLTGCGSTTTSPAIEAEAYLLDGKTVTVILDKAPQLAQVGSSAAIMDDSANVHLIIARTGEDRFVVALNECPHREKPLGYDHESEHFVCASGRSAFRLDGSIVKSPVDTPLPVYPWHLEQDRLIIDLPEESSIRGAA